MAEESLAQSVVKPSGAVVSSALAQQQKVVVIYYTGTWRACAVKTGLGRRVLEVDAIETQLGLAAARCRREDCPPVSAMFSPQSEADAHACQRGGAWSARPPLRPMSSASSLQRRSRRVDVGDADLFLLGPIVSSSRWRCRLQTSCRCRASERARGGPKILLRVRVRIPRVPSSTHSRSTSRALPASERHRASASSRGRCLPAVLVFAFGSEQRVVMEGSTQGGCDRGEWSRLGGVDAEAGSERHCPPSSVHISPPRRSEQAGLDLSK
ncbi:hypothetical protein B0H12DRAFT_1244407 [Mycena haematopus]|nr:hypothetical protein B0H12DRAFT_1244407 [Mycena haematopus]